MHYTFKPLGVCSTQIDVDIENGVVHALRYQGGCSGNLQAVGALCEGMRVEEVVKRLDGIRCDGGPTSCGDQLARNLKKLIKE